MQSKSFFFISIFAPTSCSWDGIPVRENKFITILHHRRHRWEIEFSSIREENLELPFSAFLFRSFQFAELSFHFIFAIW